MKKFLASSVIVLSISALPLLAGASLGSFGNLTETVGVGKVLSVGLNPLASGGNWTVSGNSNPGVADVNLTSSNAIIKGKAVGSSTLNLCDSLGSGCLQITVNVSSVLGAYTSAHAAGTWVLGTDGKTVYYVTSNGVIPVPTWKIFLSNGGKQSKIVPANDADMNMALLPLMELHDSRVQ